MAQVKFTKESGIKSLSGSVGRITFRTINGKTFMHERPTPELPEHPTRAQRAKYKRQVIIDACLEILQGQIEDLQEAIQLRPKLKDRLEHLYKKFSRNIKAPTKLQKAIMSEYYSRFNTEKTTRKVGNTSDKKRKV